MVYHESGHVPGKYGMNNEVELNVLNTVVLIAEIGMCIIW